MLKMAVLLSGSGRTLDNFHERIENGSLAGKIEVVISNVAGVLGLSKASISVAARQLEQLGLVQQVWVKGERKKYYRSAENIGQALQQGLLSLIRQKVDDFGGELCATNKLLDEIEVESTSEAVFLKQRVERAGKLQRRLQSVLGNPLVRLLTKAAEKR